MGRSLDTTEFNQHEVRKYAARLLTDWGGDKYLIFKHLREVRFLLRLIKMKQVDIDTQIELDDLALKMIDEDLYNRILLESVKDAKIV